MDILSSRNEDFHNGNGRVIAFSNYVNLYYAHNIPQLHDYCAACYNHPTVLPVIHGFSAFLLIKPGYLVRRHKFVSILNKCTA
jgi:hypothetical protein